MKPASKHKKLRRLIILNPSSRGGRAGKTFERLLPQFRETLGDFEIYQTLAPLDATRQVRQVLKSEEFNQILIAGGDGTFNEAVNGYFENGKLISTRIPLGILDFGTGGDFYKYLSQANPDYETALRNNHFRIVDCGRIMIQDDHSYFINIASMGIAGHILHSLDNSFFQSSKPAYLFHSLKTLVTYQPQQVHVSLEDFEGGRMELDRKIVNLFVCNGRYNGGGMNWAPEAGVETGFLYLVLLAGTSKMVLASKTHLVFSGRVSKIRGFEQYRIRKMVVSAQTPLALELDGEFPPKKKIYEVHFEVLPRCLPLVL